MKIVVDKKKCTGQGCCAGTIPGFFTLDGLGFVSFSERDASREDLTLLRAAIDGCPEHALSLQNKVSD